MCKMACLRTLSSLTRLTASPPATSLPNIAVFSSTTKAEHRSDREITKLIAGLWLRLSGVDHRPVDVNHSAVIESGTVKVDFNDEARAKALISIIGNAVVEDTTVFEDDCGSSIIDTWSKRILAVQLRHAEATGEDLAPPTISTR